MAAKYYWMAVTTDKYELPLAVAQSSYLLPRTLGVHLGTVLTYEVRSRSGKNTGRKIVKVKAPV